jgi:hypothetical protein
VYKFFIHFSFVFDLLSPLFFFLLFFFPFLSCPLLSLLCSLSQIFGCREVGGGVDLVAGRLWVGFGRGLLGWVWVCVGLGFNLTAGVGVGGDLAAGVGWVWVCVGLGFDLTAGVGVGGDLAGGVGCWVGFGRGRVVPEGRGWDR